MNDPFALWRNKERLPLDAAAALICNAVPGRAYPHKAPELTQALRDERDMVRAALRELLGAINASELAAELAYKPEPPSREPSPFLGGDRWEIVSRRASRSSSGPELDVARSTVRRGDLESWCSQRGLSPAIFKPLAGLASPEVGNAQDQELNTRSRRTALAIIAALADLGELDLSNPLASGGIGEQVAGKIEARLGKKVSARTVADYLRDARDLPREDCS